MRYRLHEIDKHHVVATAVAANRDEALEWFSEKLRLMLTFEGDPVAAEYLLDEWPESLPYMAHTPNPTIPVFVEYADTDRKCKQFRHRRFSPIEKATQSRVVPGGKFRHLSRPHLRLDGGHYRCAMWLLNNISRFKRCCLIHINFGLPPTTFAPCKNTWHKLLIFSGR